MKKITYAQYFEGFERSIGEVDVINDAPSGADKWLPLDSRGLYRFQVSDFGFTDANGDAFSGVIFSDATGLSLNGQVLTNGQFVATSDITSLEWVGVGQVDLDSPTISFQVVDDGGTDNGGLDTDQTPNTITFELIEDFAYAIGTRGDDNLVGTFVTDLIIGGRGNDTLTGLQNPDIFRFDRKFGKDTITDFEMDDPDTYLIEGDTLSFDSDRITSFKDLKKHHVEQRGDDAWIVVSKKNVLILEDVEARDLDSDFVWLP
jgi:hypothetical protein